SVCKLARGCTEDAHEIHRTTWDVRAVWGFHYCNDGLLDTPALFSQKRLAGDGARISEGQGLFAPGMLAGLEGAGIRERGRADDPMGAREHRQVAQKTEPGG